MKCVSGKNWKFFYKQVLKGPNSGHKSFDILGNRVPLTHVYIQNFDFELGLPEISQKC